MGDVRLRAGDQRAAAAAYKEGLAIQRTLAADKSNKLAQRDLAIGLDMFGEAMRKAGDLPAALAAYQESLAISRGLATDKKNALVQRDLAISLNRVAGMKQQSGDRAGALADYGESLALRRMLAADPANAPAQRDLRLGLDEIAAAKRQAGDRAGAASALEESFAILRSMGAKNPTAAEDFGEVAYEFVLARDFGPALEAADLAIAAVPDQVWLQANRAHALMLLGRTDEARTIYLAHRGRLAHGKKSWRSVILEDFAELRDAGLNDPLMSDIEKTLSADGR